MRETDETTFKTSMDPQYIFSGRTKKVWREFIRKTYLKRKLIKLIKVRLQ